MANTDRPLSPGIFAVDAQTTVPANPVPGVSYRDPDRGLATIGLGWPFQRLVNSAEFNEVMFRITSLLDLVCRTSVLAWNEQVDYQAAGAAQTPSVVASTNGNLYVALQASGPNNGGARDPATGNGAYWSQFSGLAAGADVGDVKTVAAEEPPLGWLKCNGAVVSRTQYAALFDVIGTRFGAGNGSTTFSLPDLRGEFVRGWDDGRGVDPERELGSEQEGQNALHDHQASSDAQGDHSHAITVSDGGEHAHEATCDIQGEHAHGIWPIVFNIATSLGGGHFSVGNTLVSNSTANGAHLHNISIGAGGNHTHAASADIQGRHTHNISVAVAGGSEARPRNVALLYVIKY